MRLTQYRILGQVGRGQFGRVFCGVCSKTGHLYALKYLSRTQISTYRFLRELRYLLTLKQINLVTCHGIIYDQTGRYLVLDYCEGGTLRDFISRNGQINPSDALSLVTDILLSLEEVHHQQIIHCDLKPENILLTLKQGRWRACLSDFGIARTLEEKAHYTLGKGYTGSPAYMAPERFYGHYSVASDLYSVGILLYELLVGSRPFSGDPERLAIAHLNQPVTIPECLGGPLSCVLAQALAKLPQKRFISARQMVGALQIASQQISFSASTADLPTFLLVPVIKRVELNSPITDLFIDNHSIYSVDKHLVVQYNHQFILEEKFQFNSPIYSLLIGDQTTFIITKTQLGYDLYSLSESHPLLSLETATILTAISPNAEWVTIYQDSQMFLSSWRLNQFKQLFQGQLPTEIILLDERHGCLIYLDSDSTYFKLFNRLGRIFYTFSIACKLGYFTSTRSDYSLIALAQDHPEQVFLISLKPFIVKQINLTIKPEVILVQNWGYLLVDKHGKGVLLDRKGHLINMVRIPEEFIKIAFLDYSTLLVLQDHQLLWLDLSRLL